MAEMKQPLLCPQWAVEACFTLQYVDPAGMAAVAQILLSDSCCQLGAPLSEVS